MSETVPRRSATAAAPMDDPGGERPFGVRRAVRYLLSPHAGINNLRHGDVVRRAREGQLNKAVQTEAWLPPAAGLYNYQTLLQRRRIMERLERRAIESAARDATAVQKSPAKPVVTQIVVGTSASEQEPHIVDTRTQTHSILDGGRSEKPGQGAQDLGRKIEQYLE